MERYPVAGRLLEEPLMLGYTLRDLEVVAIPAVLLVVGGILELPFFAWIWFVATGGLLAIGVLWQTPDVQTPREWVLGGLHHHLGPDRYVWQPLERNYGEGRILDVIQTAHPDASETAADRGVATAETDPDGAATTPPTVEAARSGVTAGAGGGGDGQSSAPSAAEGAPARAIFTRVRRLDAAAVSAPAVSPDHPTRPPGADDRAVDTAGGSGAAPSTAAPDRLPDR